MLGDHSIAGIQGNVAEVSATLRLLSNKKRLLVVCRLAIAGEVSVGALAAAVDLSQSALSQHLARLRADGLFETRREAQALHYRIADPRIRRLLEADYGTCCAETVREPGGQIRASCDGR